MDMTYDEILKPELIAMEKKSRAAFVTGASYGIGKATAIALA
ncbi:MAG: hypothetical protein RLY27_1900, partial [Pseudomonadota bacterium]